MLNLIGMIDKKLKGKNWHRIPEANEWHFWEDYAKQIVSRDYNIVVYENILKEIDRFKKSFQESIDNNCQNEYARADTIDELRQRVEVIDYIERYLINHKWEIKE